MSLIDDLCTDVVRSARNLLRSPGFAATAVVTLALGIGANSAMFSVLKAVVLRPLPYQDASARVMIWNRWVGFDKTWVSDLETADYKRLCPSIADVAAWSSGQANLTGDGDPVRVGVASVTPNTFLVLGAEPLLGRAFMPGDERRTNELAVLGFGLWQSRFGGDASIVGRSLLVDGRARTIIGVMGPDFRLPTDYGVDATEPTSLWTPYQLDLSPTDRGNHGLYAAARLAPGATVERANAELAAATANLTAAGLYPAAMKFTAVAVPLREQVLGDVERPMALLFGAVTLLLLIASANVASLLLARAEVRERETALRVALGAGIGRLLRQLVAEGLVLALPSALAALAVAWGGLRFLQALSIEGIPRVGEARIDAAVLGFTLLASVVALVLFSLGPALRARRINLVESLREAGTQATIGGRGMRLRSLIVVFEVALSVMLLVGASLLIRSLRVLQQVDVGFEPHAVLTARLSLPEVGYEQPEKIVAFYERLVAGVRELPGVSQAGLVRLLPLGAPIGDWGVDVEGYVETPGSNAKGDWQVATDGAIEALGERVVRGRTFARTDTSASQMVALVNETMARAYWPGRDAIGGRFRMGSNQERGWFTVVGVLKDVRHNGVTEPIKTSFVVPHSQFHKEVGFAPRTMQLVVKAVDGSDPMALVAPVRGVVRALDASVPVAAVRSMDDVVAAALSTARLAGFMLALFAALALVLSVVGIYGLLAYLVNERRHEIGIRLAVGAGGADVLRLVLASGLKLTLVGIAFGAVGALAMARLLGSLLHEIAPHDPFTFSAAPLLFLTAAAMACWLPAWRASRTDPVAALRTD